MSIRVLGFDLPRSVLDDEHIDKTQVVEIKDGVHTITITYNKERDEIIVAVINGPTLAAWNEGFRIMLLNGDSLETLAIFPEFPRSITHQQWLDARASDADVIVICHP